jgi:hypothetical protein
MDCHVAVLIAIMAENMSRYDRLFVCILVNTALVVINLRSSPEHLWFIWQLAGLGDRLVFPLHGRVRVYRKIVDQRENDREGDEARVEDVIV